MIEDLHLLAHPAPPPRRTRAQLVAIAAISLGTMVLLTGMGGEAIVASPILVPALWWAHRHTRTRLGRAGLSFLAGLVMAEAGWSLVYVSIGEREPFVWLAPLLAFAVTITIFALRRRAGRSIQKSS